ncbi:hypothetical protein [uncultured Tateyamaria sp.]|uniref:hypothetical protein n=1 Tax=uncultured Tateyamaria sp. TaxID=455651 RepID=UPI00261BEB48|nr:hypothetical protein [uncultured Tateyamaria sp.]
MSLLSLLSAPFRRGPRRPLAARQPGRDEMGQIRDVPLGMEATDLDLVDQVNRRNDALERTSTVAGQKRQTGSFAAAASTRVAPMPEDETYAARYHRAYIEKDN